MQWVNSYNSVIGFYNKRVSTVATRGTRKTIAKPCSTQMMMKCTWMVGGEKRKVEDDRRDGQRVREVWVRVGRRRRRRNVANCGGDRSGSC